MLESFSPEPFRKIILEIIKTGFYFYFFLVEIMHMSIRTKENVLKCQNKFPNTILSLSLEMCIILGPCVYV